MSKFLICFHEVVIFLYTNKDQFSVVVPISFEHVFLSLNKKAQKPGVKSDTANRDSALKYRRILYTGIPFAAL